MQLSRDRTCRLQIQKWQCGHLHVFVQWAGWEGRITSMCPTLAVTARMLYLGCSTFTSASPKCPLVLLLCSIVFHHLHRDSWLILNV